MAAQVGRVDAALMVAVALGVLARGWGLGGQSLWYDEWLTAEAVSGSLPDLLRHVANREGIPPTYFLMQWAWVRLARDGDVGLRALSVVFGAATVPVAYGIAVELRLRRAVALTAAVLVAVNPMLVWYSQEARPYSLVAFLGAVSFLCFVRVWRDPSRNNLVVWSAVAACTVAVHYFAAFLVAAEAVALLAWRVRAWRSRLVAVVPSAVALGLLVPFAIRQHSHDTNRLWISRFPLGDRLEEAGRSALVGPSPPSSRLWMVGAAVVAAACLVTVRSEGPARRAAGLAAGVAGSAVVVPVVLATVGLEDVVVGRYLIASLVPLVVAVAVGLAVTARWFTASTVAVVAVVSLVAVVAVQRDPDLQRPDWRAVAETIDDRSPGGRVVVVNVLGGMARPLARYMDGAERVQGDDSVDVTEVDVLYANSTSRPCNFLVGRACAFVFLGAPPPDPLGRQLRLVERVVLDQFTVERYEVEHGPVRVGKSDLVAPSQVRSALVLYDP